MLNISIVVLAGLPAAGKTTFTEAVARHLNSLPGYIVYKVTYDELVSSFQAVDYGKLRARALEVSKKLIVSVRDSKSSCRNCVIVVDDNMYYRSMRYEYFKLSQKHGTKFLIFVLDCNREILLERNGKRPTAEFVSNRVISDMCDKFELPKKRWERFSFLVNSDIEFDRQLLERVRRTIDECRVEEKTDKETTVNGPLTLTYLQTVELRLRKIIHDLINARKDKASFYVAKKQQVYYDIRSGKVGIENVDGDKIDTFLLQLLHSV